MEKEMSATWFGSKSLLLLTVVAQSVLLFSILFNVQIVREIVGFFYLTLVPGMILVDTLNLRHLDIGEFILFSAGLSISFLMFTGLLLNGVGPLAGIERPLSFGTFFAVFSSILLVLCIVNYFRRKRLGQLAPLGNVRFEFHFSLPVLLMLPILGVAGTILVNGWENNSLLLFTIVIVSIIVIITATSDKLIPKSYFPLLILAISIALVAFVNNSLTTQYVFGSDIHSELYALEITKNNANWFSAFPTHDEIILKAFSSLGTTIAPAMYCEVMNLGGTWLLKILYPLIAAFVSLGVYELFSTQIEKKKALLSAFFFIAISMSYGWGPGKQIVGQLFYVMLFLTIFKKGLPVFERSLLLVIFGTALVVTHYSLSYIFLFVVVFVWLFVFLSKKTQTKLRLGFIILFFTLAFSWYMFVSSGVSFWGLLENLTRVASNFFTDFFNPSSRGDKVISAIGGSAAASVLHEIGRAFFYMSEFLIVAGFAAIVYKSFKKYKKLDLDSDYFLFAVANMFILLLVIVIPNLAGTFLVERFYQIALVIVSPLCILGVDAILNFLAEFAPKLRKSMNLTMLATLLTLAVLIPNLLFQIGFVYEVSKDESWSVPLSFYRMKDTQWSYIYTYAVTAPEVSGAIWLSTFGNNSASPIYADFISQRQVLLSYGMIPIEKVVVLENTTQSIGNRYLYLRYMNIAFGAMSNGISYYNTSDIHQILEENNVVYSAANCLVIKGSE